LARKSREPHRGGEKALAPAFALHSHALACAHRERGHPLLVALDAVHQRLRYQSPSDARVGPVVHVCVGDERPRQPVGGAIEALARQRQQHIGGRQRTRRGAQFGAAVFLAARPA
jgi:hypothetical protein